MHLAIVNWTSRKVGGAETYLGNVIPELLSLGNTISFVSEGGGPSDRQELALPSQVKKFSLQELAQIEPDLIYAHGLLHPDLEEKIVELAPSVFCAHNYYGTCVSGSKTFQWPTVQHCDRKFGWMCLLNYYPRRCGGINPMQMTSGFRLQARRLKTLARYDAIITFSEHMRREYLRHGFSEQKTHSVSFETKDTVQGRKPSFPPRELKQGGPLRVLFIGRMEFLKGGQMLLQALPRVASSLDRDLEAIFVGDGPSRSHWEREATALSRKIPRLKTTFTGWRDEREIDLQLEQGDILAIPSIWPEPYGILGQKAGVRGVPVVAFASGGIPEWLEDGVNGLLAAKITGEDLASALLNCVGRYSHLSQGAIEKSRRLNYREHALTLMKIFEDLYERKPRIVRPVA